MRDATSVTVALRAEALSRACFVMPRVRSARGPSQAGSAYALAAFSFAAVRNNPTAAYNTTSTTPHRT